MFGKKMFKTTKSRRTTVRVVLTAIMAPPVVYTLYMGVIALLNHDIKSGWYGAGVVWATVAFLVVFTGVVMALIALSERIQDWINRGD